MPAVCRRGAIAPARTVERWREHAAACRNLRSNSTDGIKWSSINAAGESNFTSLSSTAAFAADTKLMGKVFQTNPCTRAEVGRVFVRVDLRSAGQLELGQLHTRARTHARTHTHTHARTHAGPSPAHIRTA